MNYTKLNSLSLRYDYYIYLDHKHYVLDEVEQKLQIPLRIMNWEASKENTKDPFHICMIRARKRYRRLICDELFPELHRALWSKYGEEYLKKCDFLSEKGAFKGE